MTSILDRVNKPKTSISTNPKPLNETITPGKPETNPYTTLEKGMKQMDTEDKTWFETKKSEIEGRFSKKEDQVALMSMIEKLSNAVVQWGAASSMARTGIRDVPKLDKTNWDRILDREMNKYRSDIGSAERELSSRRGIRSDEANRQFRQIAAERQEAARKAESDLARTFKKGQTEKADISRKEAAGLVSEAKVTATDVDKAWKKTEKGLDRALKLKLAGLKTAKGGKGDAKAKHKLYMSTMEKVNKIAGNENMDDEVKAERIKSLLTVSNIASPEEAANIVKDIGKYIDSDISPEDMIKRTSKLILSKMGVVRPDEEFEDIPAGETAPVAKPTPGFDTTPDEGAIPGQDDAATIKKKRIQELLKKKSGVK